MGRGGQRRKPANDTPAKAKSAKAKVAPAKAKSAKQPRRWLLVVVLILGVICLAGLVGTAGAAIVGGRLQTAAMPPSGDLGNVEEDSGEAELPPTEGVAATEAITTAVTAVDLNEELVAMTLDEFGGRVHYDDRFPLDGQIWDQSYEEGWILVLNAYSIHDHDFVLEDGCVVAYRQMGPNGDRVRFIGYDGQAFELAPDSGVTLNQAIAAMRVTLIEAHGCEDIQYHPIERHGDPVH